ncbi:TetR/AcrR family transcriptional regulator [Kitasatospora sp. NPDC048540]|uniref:TetR/AcrR family transcriptional regulator n=1 Tax=Kitasatospora sp. NPDC048540 TaxID=3155634 RepID=UPI0033C41E30
MARMPSAERRRQLTEAAIRAMTRDGVPRTTTRSIAAEAGVSLSVFHYCFDSKQALLEAVIEAITEHSVARVREAIRPGARVQGPAGSAATSHTGPGGTLRDTVRAGFQAYWDHVAASPGEHMLTYELTQYALRQPGFEHLARRQYELYCATYGELLEQLCAATGSELIVPVAVLARYLAALTGGLTLNHLVLGDPAGAAEILDMVADHVAGLIRAPAAQPPSDT